MPYIIQGILYNDGALGTPTQEVNDIFVPLQSVVEALSGQVTFDGANAAVELNV